MLHAVCQGYKSLEKLKTSARLASPIDYITANMLIIAEQNKNTTFHPD